MLSCFVESSASSRAFLLDQKAQIGPKVMGYTFVSRANEIDMVVLELGLVLLAFRSFPIRRGGF